jgi:hypothetical protein
LLKNLALIIILTLWDILKEKKKGCQKGCNYSYNNSSYLISNYYNDYSNKNASNQFLSNITNFYFGLKIVNKTEIHNL